MIGSRLLFSGYGVGFKAKPLHAGFLGQDVLLVHDKAHLEEPFQRLVEKIEHEQTKGRTPDRAPVRVMALTATARRNNNTTTPNARNVFKLTTVEMNPPTSLPKEPSEPVHHVWRRLKAKKAVYFHSAGAEKGAVAKQIATLAANYKDKQNAMLIFVRTLDDVGIVEKELAKTKRQVVLLTGTMRGKERDELIGTSTFKRFLKSTAPGETVYLVCTSAGEVGIDISADHLVCDLTPIDSMAQRFGRVNRYGDGDALIDVVHPTTFDEKDKLRPAREKTLTLLRQLPQLSEREDEPGIRRRDASPKALGDLRERTDLPCKIDDAFTLTPTILPATEILFDAWALTTITQADARPTAGRRLFARRRGMGAAGDPRGVARGGRESSAATYSTATGPRICLKIIRSNRTNFCAIAATAYSMNFSCSPADIRKEPAWVVDEQGRVTTWPLAKLADPSATNAAARKPLIARIEGCTVLLPPIVGGLSRGMLDGASDHADDVADIDAPATERRIRLWSDDEEYDEENCRDASGAKHRSARDDDRDDEEQPDMGLVQAQTVGGGAHRARASAVEHACRRRGASDRWHPGGTFVARRDRPGGPAGGEVARSRQAASAVSVHAGQSSISGIGVGQVRPQRGETAGNVSARVRLAG